MLCSNKRFKETFGKRTSKVVTSPGSRGSERPKKKANTSKPLASNLKALLQNRFQPGGDTEKAAALPDEGTEQVAVLPYLTRTPDVLRILQEVLEQRRKQDNELKDGKQQMHAAV
jgi:hypothetical protein